MHPLSSSSLPALLPLPSREAPHPIPPALNPESPTVPSLRKAHSLSGRIELVQNVVLEQFSEQGEPSSPPSFRKANSDPARALRPMRPPYQLKPESQLDAPQLVHAKAFFRKLQDQYPVDPFIRKISEKTTQDLFLMKRENLTNPRIAFPKKCALEYHVQAYKQKYDITIRLASLATLPALLDQLAREVPKPSYVGLIVAETEDDLQKGHVAPVLCSYGQTRIECLVMDVLGGRGRFAKSLHVQLRHITHRSNILTAAGDRQFDNFSCRTGALSLLRNALLSLRYHGIREGLREQLPMLIADPSLEMDPDYMPLPSEWTYVEQAFHGNPRALAIRDLFSSKQAKRENPRTVEVFRQAHTESTCFRCTLQNGKDYRADFVGLIPPPGVQAIIKEDEFSVTFEVTVPANTHLLKKGFRRAGMRL